MPKNFIRTSKRAGFIFDIEYVLEPIVVICLVSMPESFNDGKSMKQIEESPNPLAFQTFLLLEVVVLVNVIKIC